MILVKGGKAGFIQKEPWQLGEEGFLGGGEGYERQDLTLLQQGGVREC